MIQDVLRWYIEWITFIAFICEAVFKKDHKVRRDNKNHIGRSVSGLIY